MHLHKVSTSLKTHIYSLGSKPAVADAVDIDETFSSVEE